MTTTATPRTITRRDLAAKVTTDEMAELDLAVHEAAHSVVGTVLGGEVRSVALTRAGGSHGLRGLTRFRDLAEPRRPDVAYAGPWSQASWRAGGGPTQPQVQAVLSSAGCHDDALMTATGGRHLTVSPETPRLVERCWPSLLVLAGRLFKNGEASHADVLDALGLSGLSEQAAAFGLANIRSGSAPNTFRIDGTVRF
jgi:hypothetical protein